MGADAHEGLRRRLVALTFLRLAIVTVLLGGAAITTWRAGEEAADAAAPLYAVILATYAVSLLFAVALRAHRGEVPLAFAQIGVDVTIAAVVVAESGGTESVFVFLFSLAVVNGSILLARRGAIAAAAGAAIAYAVVVLTPVAQAPRALSPSKAFVHAAAFFLTAALASYLAEQLRRTGERLEKRESDLATITALHESIVQSVASGLLTVNAAGEVGFLNRAGEQITGLRLNEVRGQPARQWFSCFEAGAGRGETPFLNARGERLRIGYSVSPLIGPGGQALGSAVVFQDLTELRAMEEAVQRSERLADLGRVAAGLAHELRNPLASMSGSIELLRANPRLEGEDQRLMDIVLREATRLDQLVTRFLEFTRPALPRRETVDLARVLQETLQVFENDPAAAEVRLERSLSPAPAWCDPDQMRQVFWNLLANAAQSLGAASGAAPPGRGGGIRVSCAPEVDGGARVEVRDAGSGIAAADLGRIFTPFFTTKERGSGLGLATVQRIVDAHGGSVTVDSAVGRGSTFTVRLPPASAAPRRDHVH